MPLKPLVNEISRSAFVRRVATFQVGFLVSVGIGMLSSVVYPMLLGPRQYGLYAVVMALAGLLSIIVSFGQEVTLTTFLSEAVGKKDRTAIQTVLAYFAQATFAASILYALLIIIAPYAGLLQGNASVGLYARWVLLNSALQFPAVLLFITLQLGHHIRLITILENIRTALQFGLSTLLIVQGWEVMGILIGTLAISILYVPLCILLYRRYAKDANLPGLRDILRNMRRGGTRTYFAQGLWIAIDRNTVSNLHPNILIMLLGATASLEVVGIARLGLRLAMLPATFLAGSIARVASVTVPQLLVKDRKNFASAAIKLIFGSVGLHALAGIGAAILIPPLIPYVYGTEFRAVIPVLLIMLPLNLFTSSHMISIPLLRLSKKIYMNTLNFALGLGIAIAGFLVLRTMIDPLIAFSLAVLYVHAHGILIYLYIWHWLFRSLPTPQRMSRVIRSGMRFGDTSSTPE